MKPSINKSDDYKKVKPGKLHSFKMTGYYHPQIMKGHSFEWFNLPKVKSEFNSVHTQLN